VIKIDSISYGGTLSRERVSAIFILNHPYGLVD
jgi:hypothetical protein